MRHIGEWRHIGAHIKTSKFRAHLGHNWGTLEFKDTLVKVGASEKQGTLGYRFTLVKVGYIAKKGHIGEVGHIGA